MYIDAQHTSTQPIGMGGFFSWLKKAVKATFKAVTTVVTKPSSIIDVFEDFLNGDGVFMGIDFQQEKAAEPILTPQDEAQLDNWVNTKFTPYFKSLLTDVKNAVLNPGNKSKFVQLYNRIQEFKAVIKWHQGYVLLNRDNGLSLNAVKARNQFLDIQLRLLDAQVNEYLRITNTTPNLNNRVVVINKLDYAVFGFKFPVRNLELPISLYVISQQEGNETVEVVEKPEPTLTQGNSKAKTNLFKWFAIGFIAYKIFKK